MLPKNMETNQIIPSGVSLGKVKYIPREFRNIGPGNVTVSSTEGSWLNMGKYQTKSKTNKGILRWNSMNARASLFTSQFVDKRASPTNVPKIVEKTIPANGETYP